MFPEDPEDPRPLEECLPDAAEELLVSWPLAPKSDDEWEALASAIDGKVRITERGSTTDELLQPPLPELPDEGREVQRRSHPRMKRPSVGNLTMLARAKLGGSALDQARERDPSDERSELARALLSQAVKARSEAQTATPVSPTPSLASANLAALVNSSSQRTAVATRSREAAALAAPPPALPERVRSQERRMWLGVAFGIAGMAAAVIMYVSAGRSGVPQSALAVNDASLAAPAQTATAHAAPVAEQGASRERSVSVEEIPLEERARSEVASSQTPATTEKPLATRSHASTARARPAVAENSGPARAAEPAQAEPSAAEPEAPPTAGPSEPGMVMADSRHGNIPDKPSTGAVQAAIGSVMGAARACVAGQSAASRASVEFGSDGRVRSVSISGPAAGTPAESCLRTALSGARVQPFSRSNYLVNLSVRPL